jgi:hypothetical protein
MSEEQARRTLSWPSFLKLAAAAGGTAVEGPNLAKLTASLG